jgi:hypothetical protein
MPLFAGRGFDFRGPVIPALIGGGRRVLRSAGRPLVAAAPSERRMRPPADLLRQHCRGRWRLDHFG